VPVSYYSRSHAEGKKINAGDAVDCLHILFRVRTRRKSRLTKPVVQSEQAVAGDPTEASPELEATMAAEAATAVEASMPLESAEADDAARPESVPVLNGLASRA
jgi:hypothetical protein